MENNVGAGGEGVAYISRSVFPSCVPQYYWLFESLGGKHCGGLNNPLCVFPSCVSKTITGC